LQSNDDDEQSVESWNPAASKELKENTDLVEMSEIDLLERSYMQEYDYIINKDKEEGKDFNRLAA